MSDVRDWNPTLQTLGATHRELLNTVAAAIDGDTLSLTTEQCELLKSLFQIGSSLWMKFAQDANDEELVCWIKVLTLCPEQYSGFDHGARSPVITLARILRLRGTYPNSLTAWIKQHSTNRFLPHGSIADRLR